LAFSNNDDATEKINFLSALSTLLGEIDYFPYAATAGEEVLKKRISQYFNSYFYTKFNPGQFVISPSSLSIIHNILHTYSPDLIIVDRFFSDKIDNLNNLSTKIIASPTSSFELCSLIEKIKPQFVITTIHEKQVSQVDSFKSILTACEKVNARLIVDISPYLELSSSPNKISVLSYVSEFG
jgi:methionine S-methyltransferase